MLILSKVLVAIVAALHLYFLLLQKFLWTEPYGLNNFRMTLEDALVMETLAANQGVYNGLLAVGLIAGLFIRHPVVAKTVVVFCLLFIIAAGLFGASTVSVRIFFFQSLPAILALAAVLYSDRRG